jgi:hypothetical protein
MSESPEQREVPLRTGAEGPLDPEDLAMADGVDPTPENIEKYRRMLEEKGPRAVEEIVP